MNAPFQAGSWLQYALDSAYIFDNKLGSIIFVLYLEAEKNVTHQRTRGIILVCIGYLCPFYHSWRMH